LTRRRFADVHLVALHEQLDTKHATTTERIGDSTGNVLRFLERDLRHRLRLPGLTVVAFFLAVADRRTEAGAVAMAHGQQGDFVIEIDEAFDNHLALAGAAAALGVVPGGINIGVGFYRALALAGG